MTFLFRYVSLGKKLSVYLYALSHLLIWKHGVRGCELAVSRHQHRREDGRFYPLVVVRIDADFLLFGTEGKFAAFQRLEFVMRLKVRPTPNSAIYHVRKSFAMRDLEMQEEILRQ